MAFFADDREASCQANDTSQGLVLTTSTLPNSYTCFNLTDIFSQNNDTGFQDSQSQISHPPDERIHPNGIHWLLRNRDSFDRQANYSRVWYEQVNQTGEAKAGEDAPWVFYIYAFPDCEQTAGDDVEYDQNPWFETSCQTEAGGQCRTVPNPIRSFAIHSAREYNIGHGGCETWAFLGGATNLGDKALQLAVVSASAAALFLAL